MSKAQSPILSFESDLPPLAFTEKAKNILINEPYTYFTPTEKGFYYQLNATHGGQVYFECEVLPNGNGSIINGKVLLIPWREHEQTKAEKIRDIIITVLVCIVFFPITIGVGIDMLFFRLSKKRKFTPDEKKAIRFMTKNLNCTYKEIIE